MSQIATSLPASAEDHPCPMIGEAAKLAALPDSMISSPPLPLGQAWLKEPSGNFLPGAISVAWTPDFLYVFATLTDADIFNPVTEFNQPAYLTGDIFEILVRAEKSDAYFEFHITPFGQVLQLKYPQSHSLADFAASASNQSVADAFRFPPRVLEAETEISPGQKNWKVLAKVPAQILSITGRFSPGDRLKVSFCRYDYTRSRPEPELSSTSDHPVRSFHRLEEWRTMVLVDSDAINSP